MYGLKTSRFEHWLALYTVIDVEDSSKVECTSDLAGYQMATRCVLSVQLACDIIQFSAGLCTEAAEIHEGAYLWSL